MLFGGVFE